MPSPDSRDARRRRWPWIVLGVFAALILAAVLFPWDWVKGPIERKVSASTGRQFSMQHLDVSTAGRRASWCRACSSTIRTGRAKTR